MSKHLYKNWYVEDESNFSVVDYQGNTCYKLTPSGTTLDPAANYCYTNFLYPYQVGNSVTIKSNVGASISQLIICDGSYSVLANIGNNEITIGSDSFSFDTYTFTNYTLDLLNGEYKFYIDDEIVLTGSATTDTSDPHIYYGFISNPIYSDTAYISYLKSGKSVIKKYKVGEWTLNDIHGYSVVTYEGTSCGGLTPTINGTSILPNYFYKDDVYPSSIGNSVCAKVAFDAGHILLADSDNYMLVDDDNVIFADNSKSIAQLFIADGTHMVVANIGDGAVTIGSDTFTVSTTQFHSYWLTLKDGKYQLFVDRDLVLEGNAISAIGRRISFGFTDVPKISDNVFIKYLKTVKGIKRPIDLSKISFELQVDTTDTFDSVNLKSYYNIDNLVYNTSIVIESHLQAQTGRVTLVLDGIAGNVVDLEAAEGSNIISRQQIAQAICTSGLPDGWSGFVSGSTIYLQKINLESIESTTPENNKLIFNTISEDITPRYSLTFIQDSTALGEGIVRSFTIPILPRQDMRNICYFFRVRANSDYYTSDWAYYYFDEPAIDVLFSTKDIMKTNRYIINKLMAFCYEDRQSYMLITNPSTEDYRDGYIQVNDSTAIWVPVSSSYFLLDVNKSSYYFDQIYNYRLPDNVVYTKYDKSGNIANAIEAQTVVLDIVDFEIRNSQRDLSVHLCRDTDLYNNFGKKYGLAQDYFNTVNEFRNTLLYVVDKYCEPGNTSALISLLASISGVAPHIEELKFTKPWILWERSTALTKDDSEQYILFNPKIPYTKKNHIVLRSREGKAFTFNIHLYNPLGLSINPDLVKAIVDAYKPSFSQANIIFYTEEGKPYTYPATYYFSNYGQGLFYREDTQENK